MTSDKLYIIQKVKEKDSNAMRILYEEHYQFVLDYCHRYLMNYSHAKDMTQDIFLHVFDKINTYKATGEFGAWLNVVCRNYILTYLQKEKKNRFVAFEDHFEFETEDEDIDVDEFHDFRNNLSVEEIYSLLGELDTKSRTIFNLYAIDGLTHKEIAVQLGISAGTSKSQLSRARVKLKQVALKEIERKKKAGLKTIRGLVMLITAIIGITIKKIGL